MISSVANYLKEKVDSWAEPLKANAKTVVTVAGLAALVGYSYYGPTAIPSFQQPMSVPLPTGTEFIQAAFEMEDRCSLHCTSFHPNKTSLLDVHAISWIAQKAIKEVPYYAWALSAPTIVSVLQSASDFLPPEGYFVRPRNFLYYACTDAASLFSYLSNDLRSAETELQKAPLQISEFRSDDSRNKLLWLESSEPNDRAFSLYPGHPLLKGLTRAFQVKWSPINYPQDICQAIRLHGGQLAGLVIAAHGDQQGLQFRGHVEWLSTDHLPAGCFAPLHPYAVILLVSCSTASSLTIHRNFASQLQEMAQRTVIAASDLLYNRCIHLKSSNLSDVEMYLYRRYPHPCLDRDPSGLFCDASAWSHPHEAFCTSTRIDVTYQNKP